MIISSDTVVDIAFGYGEFLNNIQAGKKIAVDLNPDARRFLNSEIEFHQCMATNLGFIVKGSADIVFTSNFLEHLPGKKTLDEFLSQVLVALKPGGKYIILGPNLRYLPGEYWDFYDHHLGLTHFSLSEALQLKGFNVAVCIDRFLPYTTRGALPKHPWLFKAYLKLSVVWKFLGNSLFKFLLHVHALFTGKPPFTAVQFDALSARDEFHGIDTKAVFGVRETPLDEVVRESYTNPTFSHIQLNRCAHADGT